MIKFIFNGCFYIFYIVTIIVFEKETVIGILIVSLAIQYSTNQILESIEEME